MNTESDVFTVQEVADMLKVHPYTVNRMIRTGRLKAFKLSRRYRIRKEDLDAFMLSVGTEGADEIQGDNVSE